MPVSRQNNNKQEGDTVILQRPLLVIVLDVYRRYKIRASNPA